jgi:alkaline phosphatase D
MKKIIYSTLLFIISLSVQAQVQSGPMLGYSEMKEVLLWIQTKEASLVKFNYWEKDTPSIKFSTESYQTNNKEAFVAKLVADKVLPGKRYTYEVLIPNPDPLAIPNRSSQFQICSRKLCLCE